MLRYPEEEPPPDFTDLSTRDWVDDYVTLYNEGDPTLAGLSALLEVIAG